MRAACLRLPRAAAWLVTAIALSATPLVAFAQTHDITATAGAGGTIDPPGVTAVPDAGSQSYSITADPCYSIADVTVDGGSIGAMSSYTFSGVTEDHTISATFSLNGPFLIFASVSADPIAGGTIVPAGSGFKPAFFEDFTGLSLPSGWSSYTWTGSGNSTVSGSYLIVDGARANPEPYATGPGSSLQFTAEFGPDPFQHGGFGGGNQLPSGEVFGTGPWAIFSTGTSGTDLQARVLGSSGSDFTIPGSYIGSTHLYRIDWNVSSIDFYIDGSLVHSETQSISGPMRPAFSDYNDGGAVLKVNYVWVSSYSTSAACGSDLTFDITPDDCYQTTDVLVDGSSVGTPPSYTFTNIQATHTISATFEYKTFVISVSAGTGGTVLPHFETSSASGVDRGRRTSADYDVEVGCAGSQKFDITADACYTIGDVLVDGSSIGAQSSYTFTDIQANHTISATFNAIVYTVTASAGTGGTIDPDGAVSVVCGTDKTFNISPASCYGIADVLVDGVSVGAVPSYTFTDVQTDHTIAASFTPLGPFTITASAGPGGIIDPSGAVSVACGADKTFNILPDGCHTIANVLVDGVSVGAVATYTFNDVAANHTIAASFSVISYTITASAGAGGTISPSGAVSVACSTDKTFTISSDACHTIADVLVDGSSAGAATSYTFTDVHANHTISATFNAISYTIAASAGAGGTISPSGSVSAACGVNKTFTITANTCFQIANVLVDGASVGAVTSYTFPSVSANHTIAASFSSVLAIAETHTNATCAAEPNGSVDLSVSGGLGPYLYSWSSGETTEDITEVAPGTYTVVVTDSRGCSASKVATVGAIGSSTIVATAIGGGTVSPMGSSVVTCGADQSYIITPSPGFAVASVLVDHLNVGPVASYDFTNVTGHHTIDVVFGQTTAAENLPKEFALSTVYPNPSHGEANIGFAVPREARVNLSVVDVAGRLVTTIASGTYPPGRYQLPWKAALSHARAGLYFVRFEADGHHFVRNIVLAP